MSEETKQTASAPHECVCGGAGPALTEFLKRMGPPEAAKSHFDQARVEFLKGLRSLIDHRIEQLSRQPEKGTKLTVE
jgi:hypothetical protein